MPKIKVSVHGCDASTEVELRVSDSEMPIIDYLVGLVNLASSYQCEPTMEVTILND